ncbi:MAG: glycoside hydrolase family 127 protein [Prevotella sp.]|nr:glycoside hydrolase family 127 protein [Prevotella sp.]
MRTILKTLAGVLLLLTPTLASSQGTGLSATHSSPHAVMHSLPLDATRWSGGFWGERFQVFSHTSVQSMWDTWQSPEGKGFNNFLIASGEKQGEHHGPPFHDGDMYKWLEAVASVYAITHDPELEQVMDRFIGCVVKSQRADGYIHTPVIIAELNKRMAQGASDQDNTVVGTATGKKDDSAFGNRLNFETYNLGHLITAGIIHKRATGKSTLFQAAVKAADFLYRFCMEAPEELAGNAICPSHYMAVAELYRETNDTRYLELCKKFIDIRGMVQSGTDDNQDRIPFREQYNAMGHAVRANYLYAGVADLFLESGEAQLMRNLTSIWDDIVTRKMYINGACGALYDGTSPDGTDYTPDNIQKVHQSYGRPYQLPQSTAHNETCANIGNMLFNWRMLMATGDGKYADIMENCYYNSILPGISLDGEKYFYTNPLRLSDELPYKLRWPKERKKLISCFCCPPNTLRTLCQAQDYAYAVSNATLWVNLYGSSTLTATLDGVGALTVEQSGDYPWDGHITLRITKMKGKKAFKFKLRKPEWCEDMEVKASNGATPIAEHGYLTLEGTWQTGSEVSIYMPMPVRLLEANPLVEEARGQVAVQRGPIIYCAESQDLGGADIDALQLPLDATFTPMETHIDGSRIMALECEAVVRDQQPWSGTLYRPAANAKHRQTIRLIPYYAWGNRGKSEMTVWIPAAW